MTWTHFSRCGNSLLSLSHLPFPLLACGGLIATIACKPRLLSSFDPPLFGFVLLQQGFVWWVWTVHNPLRIQSMQSIQAFANLSMHRVFWKKTSGHEARWDINNPCFQKVKIRKSLCWNIKWHWVEDSMLVMFDSFNDFFFFFFCNFVLCDKKGTSEKKNCPMMVAISVGFARHALKKLSEIPVPLHRWRVVETTQSKTSWVSQWFSRQMNVISIQGS